MITASKFFLYKDIPGSRIGINDMLDAYTRVNTYVNLLTSETNKVNELLLKNLDTSAAAIRQGRSQLGPIVSTLSDILVVGSEGKDSMDLFDKDVKVSGEGITIDSNTKQIYLERTPLLSHHIQDISIGIERGSIGNTTESTLSHFNIDNMTSTISHTEFESYSDELRMSVVLDLADRRAVNSISFKLVSFGTRSPVIEEIANSEDGCSFEKILIKSSNDYSMDIDDFGFRDGHVVINTKEINSRYIRLTLVQKMPHLVGVDRDKRYAIGINSMKIGFFTAKSSGKIVLGPMNSDAEILKVAISADVQNEGDGQTVLSVSHDNESWIPIKNSEVFSSADRLSKLINYNNISINSQRTPGPIHSIYLKIEMQSFDVSKLNPESRFITKDLISISRNKTAANISAAGSPDFMEVLQETGTYYGRKQSISSQPVELSIDRKNISEVYLDGDYIVNSVGFSSPGVRDVLDPILAEDNYVILFKEDSVFIRRDDKIQNDPSMSYDPFSIEIRGRSGVLRDDVSIKTGTDDTVSTSEFTCIIPINIKQGIYNLRFDNSKVQVDLSSGMIYSVYESLYVLSPEIKKVTLENELGEKLRELTIRSMGDLKYISLIDDICEQMPDHAGYMFSSTVPLQPLKSKEYTILQGKVVFGSYYSGKFPLPRFESFPIETQLESAPSGSILISDQSKQIMHEYKLEDEDLKKIIKLNHCNILPGTVSFDVRGASINAMIQEVQHIDGVSEFIVKKKFNSTGHRDASSIILHDDFIDDGELKFKLCSTMFKQRVKSLNELIEIGHYFVDTTSAVKRIILPSGIRTTISSDIALSYNIKPLKRSSSGLYSVDYRRGILYSTTPIDGKSIIKYQYSSVSAKYMGFIISPKSGYTISGQSIVMEHNGDVPVKYLVLRSGREKSVIEYRATPIMNDIKLSLINTESVI